MAYQRLRRSTDPVDPAAEAAAAAALYGRRGQAPIRPAPRTGAMVARILKPLLPEAGVTLGELKRRWAEIVGEKLAQVTAPEKLTKSKDGGVLTIRVAGSAAPFVQHQAPLLLERVRLAGGEIKTVSIQQGPLPRAPATNLRPISAPLSADEEKALAQALSGVEDPRLKAALARLGKAAAMKGKGR